MSPWPERRSRLAAIDEREPGDLLGLGDELIHIKRDSGSASLSRLFSKDSSPLETLMASAVARKQFASAVAAFPRGARAAGRLRAKEGGVRHLAAQRYTAQRRHTLPVLPG